HSDLKLNFGSFTAVAPVTATPMAGMTFTATANLTVQNLGPDGPTSASGSATLVLPSDCHLYDDNPASFTASPASGQSASVAPSWQVTCSGFGAHSFTVNASVAATDVHVTDASGNNTTTGTGSTTLKVGACGADPHPAGNIVQNLSP